MVSNQYAGGPRKIVVVLTPTLQSGEELRSDEYRKKEMGKASIQSKFHDTDYLS